MGEDKRFDILTQVVSIIFFVLMLIFGHILSGYSQTNVMNREVVSRDTINAVGYVHVQEYVNKKGEVAYKARWCGKAINISASAANDILEGSDAYVIVARYNNGEVIRQKVITLYSK